MLRVETSKVRSLELSATRRDRPAVVPSISQSSSRARTVSPPYTRWYPMALPTPILAVYGLAPQVSRKALFDRFKGYGYIHGIDIGGWEVDNRTAFIYYSDAGAVQRALQANVGALPSDLRHRVHPY